MHSRREEGKWGLNDSGQVITHENLMAIMSASKAKGKAAVATVLTAVAASLTGCSTTCLSTDHTGTPAYERNCCCGGVNPPRVQYLPGLGNKIAKDLTGPTTKKNL